VGVRIQDKDKRFGQGFGKNTGFGLFLVREILAITGMTIGETGFPGKGAQFRITVPQENYRFRKKREQSDREIKRQGGKDTEPL